MTSLADALALGPEKIGCMLSCHIEGTIFRRGQENVSILFKKDAKSGVPDEDCPVCLAPLSGKPDVQTCCGDYARKLLKCKHWVHVCCQINRKRGSNIIRCPICRVEQVDEECLALKVREYYASFPYVPPTADPAKNAGCN